MGLQNEMFPISKAEGGEERALGVEGTVCSRLVERGRGGKEKGRVTGQTTCLHVGKGEQNCLPGDPFKGGAEGDEREKKNQAASLGAREREGTKASSLQRGGGEKDQALHNRSKETPAVGYGRKRKDSTLQVMLGGGGWGVWSCCFYRGEGRGWHAFISRT